MTVEFYSRLMSEYFERLTKAVIQCANAIEDMELATEAIEKSMPLEKKCFSEKNFLTATNDEGDPNIYDYIASMNDLTRREKEHLSALSVILAIIRLPVEEMRNDE